MTSFDMISRNRSVRARCLVSIGLGCMLLLPLLGIACGPDGGIGGFGGSGGSSRGGSGGKDSGPGCVNAGDSCTPGAAIVACVVGADCCKNTCVCGTNGKASCTLVCDASLGGGGACGAGADAGKDAGGAGAGSLCSSDSECQAGLKCCYPCGIPDCHNQCMAPMRGGMCPLFP